MDMSTKLVRLLLICSIVMTGGCGDVDLTDAEHVQRAKQMQAEGDLRSTVIELKNALKLNPENPEARTLAGEVYLKLGSGADAEKELTKARELGVHDDYVIPLLLESMLLQGKYEDILDFPVDTITSDESIADVLASRGMAFYHTQKLQEAHDVLEKALEHNPDSLRALVAMAYVSVARRDFDDAKERLDAALSIDESYGPAWSVLGDIAQLNNDDEKAVEAYSKAISNSQYAGANDLKRAMLLTRLKQYEAAQSDIDRLRKRFKKLAKVNFAQGMLYFYQEKFKDAESEFEEALRLDEREIWSRYYLGVIQYLQGKNEQARDNLSRFVAAVPQYVPSRKFLALVSMRYGQFGEAEKLLRPVVKALPKDTHAMNFLATALLEQGKSDEAIALFERIVKLDPDSGEARMRLGLGLLMQGDTDRGFQSLQSAVDVSPDLYSADVLLIINYLQKGKIELAQQAAEKFMQRQPENAVAYTLMGKVYLAKDQVDLAQSMFKKAQELSPGDPVAGTQLAALALKAGDYERVDKEYKAILARNENHFSTLLNLASLEARRGNRDEMIRLLRETVDSYPDAVQPRVLLAREYLKMKDPGKAYVVLRDILNGNLENPVVLGVLAEVQLELAEYVDAKRTLDNLAKYQPDFPEIHFFMAKAYQGLGNADAYRKELQQALKLAPDYIPARIAMTRLQLADGKIEQAIASLKELKQLADEGDPDVEALEALLMAEAGDAEKSLALYRKLYTESPGMDTLRAYTRLLWIQGQRDKSVAELRKWVDEHPNEVDGLLELANSYIGLGRHDDAIDLYRHVLDVDADNLVALNNLAWNLRKREPKQALAYAEKAIARVPNAVPAIDTLAMVLLENGDYDQALRNIDRALERNADAPGLRYHRALILEKMGREAEARQILELLVSQQPSFQERAEAELMLERLTK